MRRLRWAGFAGAVVLVVSFAVEPASAVRARRTTVPKRARATRAAATPTTAASGNRVAGASAAGLAAALPVVVGTKTVVGVTPVASAGSLRVSALGTPNVAATRLADQALVAHRDRLSRLRGAARPGLFADPVSTEDIVQTTDGTYFVGTTSMNVVNPASLAANGIRNVRPEPGLTVNSLDAAQRADFNAYKAEALRRPAGDPMHDAAQQGDQALLDAIAAGKGPVLVTTSIFVPAGNLEMVNRTVQAPSIRDGEYDYTSRRARTLNFVPPRTSPTPASAAVRGQAGSVQTRTSTAARRAVATTTTRLAQGAVAKRGFSVAAATSGERQSSGTDDSKSHFLTGWTIDGGVTWKETWDFGFVGDVTITAEAWYAVGLRAPVLMTGTISPSNLVDNGDPGEPYTVQVSADVIDGDRDFYESTGLAGSQLYDGKEFVLEAGAHVKVKGNVLGANFNKTIPENDSFDFGDNFQLPYGSCGTNCGFNLWVPATATRTSISVLGIVTGSAQIGFNVSGTGDVEAKYSALDNGAVIASSRSGAGAANVQTFSDDGIGSDMVFSSTMPGGDSRQFGYRLSDPTYTWNIVVTPGVKGTIDINARPFYSDTIGIGPLWIDAAAFSLASFTLPTHAGTTSSRDRQPGSYTAPINRASESAAGAAVGSGAQAITTTTSGGMTAAVAGTRALVTTTTAAPRAGVAGAAGVQATPPTMRSATQRQAAPATTVVRRRRARATVATAAPVATVAPAQAAPKAGRRARAARTTRAQG